MIEALERLHGVSTVARDGRKDRREHGPAPQNVPFDMTFGLRRQTIDPPQR